MLLPPPEFFCNDCLNLNLGRILRLDIAQKLGKGEPAVRRWFREDDFPPEAFDTYLAHLEKMAGEELVKDIQAVSKDPFQWRIEATKWRMFCQGLLAHGENCFLPETFREILSYSLQWTDAMQVLRDFSVEGKVESFKGFLIDIVGPRFELPRQLCQQIQQCKALEELRPVFKWLIVEAFIYFVAMAEAEYLQRYYNIEESKISKLMLPRLQKGKMQYPVKLFFGYFFDNLVHRGFFRSLGEIAENMPRVLPLDSKAKEEGKSGKRVDPDSGWREIKRAKYQGKAPSFETFSAWVNALIPGDIYPTSEDRELEKQLLYDALGAARILEKFIRRAVEDVPEVELLDHFSRYDDWYRYHLNAFTETGA